MKPWIYALFGNLMFVMQNAYGGQGVVSGREPTLWSDGHYNVVVGVIRDIKKVADPNVRDGRWSATLQVKASLAGKLDPSMTPTLRVIFYADHYGSSIKTAPPDGSTILAIVELGYVDSADNGDKDAISSDVASFMPNDSALVVVKGLDDPNVDETLKRIQEARAHPLPDSNAPKPANKPAVLNPK